MERFIYVTDARMPIYIKDNKIVVKLLNGKEYNLFQHDEKAYLYLKLNSYLTHGLSVREQGLIMQAYR